MWRVVDVAAWRARWLLACSCPGRASGVPRTWRPCTRPPPAGRTRHAPPCQYPGRWDCSGWRAPPTRWRAHGRPAPHCKEEGGGDLAMCTSAHTLRVRSQPGAPRPHHTAEGRRGCCRGLWAWHSRARARAWRLERALSLLFEAAGHGLALRCAAQLLRLHERVRRHQLLHALVDVRLRAWEGTRWLGRDASGWQSRTRCGCSRKHSAGPRTSLIIGLLTCSRKSSTSC